MPFTRFALVAAVSSALCGEAFSTCMNSDYQVKVLRYYDDQCADTAEERVATYQSGSAIYEIVTEYKTFTCCDDAGSVTVMEVDTNSQGIETKTTNTVDTNICLTGTAADTGGQGTDKKILGSKFQCIKTPSEPEITISVYHSTDTSCSSSIVPSVHLPTYEGCNEDFPIIMDLLCDGTDVQVKYSMGADGTDNAGTECEKLASQTVDSFTLMEGCNVPTGDVTYFGFTSPVEVVSTCGQGGLSPGGAAAVAIIVIILVLGGAFALWWFKFRTATSKNDGDLFEFNEYSQLDGDQVDTDLL